MGLISRLLSPWRIESRLTQYEQVHVDLLREVMEVAKAQTHTAEALAHSLEAISRLYEVTTGNDDPRESPADINVEFVFPEEEDLDGSIAT